MEQIIVQLKERETLTNRLISHIFEYTQEQQFPTKSITRETSLNKILKLINNCDKSQTLIKLIRLNVENKFYYLKEEELTNDQINIYILNSSLADLELVGYIKNNTLKLLNNDEISFNQYSEE